MTTVGLLHPGQMGAAVGAQIAANGHTVLWCPTGRSHATQHRASEAHLEPVDELATLLEGSQIVLSVCPPAAAEHIARQIASIGFHGVLVEANAISPQRAHRINTLFTEQETVLVDGSIIGPAPTSTASTRLYLAGPADASAAVASLVTGTQIEPHNLGTQIGKASAVKWPSPHTKKPAVRWPLLPTPSPRTMTSPQRCLPRPTV